MTRYGRWASLGWFLSFMAWGPSCLVADDSVPVRKVDGQPLGANVIRVLDALEYLGQPLPDALGQRLRDAAGKRDDRVLQELLDQQVLFVVSLNPEVRVNVQRGPATPRLQQAGYTCQLVKVINDSSVTRALRIFSSQSGPVYSGPAEQILKRQAQTELRENENGQGKTDRFLDVEMFSSQPMTGNLSGLEVEYAIAMIYCHESGRREATIGFDVGAGTQDIGFRGALPVLFDVRPARPIEVRVLDEDGTPTTARMTFRDRMGRVFPPQIKRLAPDFFFQPQVYRADGDSVLLPPDQLTVTFNRGPEYVTRSIDFDAGKQTKPLTMQLRRWVNPMDYGFFCGDHHIHGAGCSHYDNPTQGVSPSDMFRQVKGEGLNVGCVLTWGPCFDAQRKYFSPIADTISETDTILKYDLEISGFGSAALGHVCLLRLKDQTYPGSKGSKLTGWPTWTVPVMRWAKEQGGVTGYPHSAMPVNPKSASARMINRFDGDSDGFLTAMELDEALLPWDFGRMDENGDAKVGGRELIHVFEQAANELPNLCVPEMNGAGALEICVSAAEGVCDFISAMDTQRIAEWNTWYHLLNCGFPIKLSGETDFPCMSSRRVGQGRVYVHFDEPRDFSFETWVEGLARGRSYVSDGFAHALELTVQNRRPGDGSVHLDSAGNVEVRAVVAFAAVQPKTVAQGGITPAGGKRVVGDTVQLHAPRDSGTQRGGERLVEFVVNGKVIDRQAVPADGKPHEVRASLPVVDSSWVAIRQFPQLHTNPVNVIVADRPIRASESSARWCQETINLLWKNRERFIVPSEREAARESYDRALRKYDQIADEARRRAKSPVTTE